jgi:uncharacterized protein involved in type VI secretion and phage assembly
MRRFFGKYRGKVVQNVDNEQRGRLLVTVPAVLGTGQGWAMPAVPMSGMQAGVYVVPPPAANVWVEFESGDPDRPIWTGCFWERGETPSLALAPPPPVPHILLQTTGQNAIHITDVPGPTGGIMLKSATGRAMIVVNDTHILITNGTASIELVGKSVIINQGALAVDFP